MKDNSFISQVSFYVVSVSYSEMDNICIFSSSKVTRVSKIEMRYRGEFYSDLEFPFWQDLRAKSISLYIRALHIVNDKNFSAGEIDKIRVSWLPA